MSYTLHASGGQVVCVDGDRIVPPDTPTSFGMDLGEGIFRPGLINSHDHLFLNHFPRLGQPPYKSAYQWADDIHARFKTQIQRSKRLAREEAVLFGALKNLIAGVTAVVHHDPWDDSLGNCCPLRLVRVRVAHSLKLERDLSDIVAQHTQNKSQLLSMHLAEGVDEETANEVQVAAELGLVDDRLIAVHVVNVDTEGIKTLSTANAAVVWCPTSNEFLFDRTTPRALIQSGVDVLLGSDSLLTAQGTLLDELRHAREHELADDRRLLSAVGEAAARRLMLPEPSLEPGHAADLVFLRRPILEAEPRDISLVLVGGQPRLGDAEFAELFERCGVKTEPLSVGGRRKLVVSPLATIAAKAIELTPECGRIFD